MTKTIVELCCGTVDEIKLAARFKVDRIELCAALACGGVTPSFAMLEAALTEGLETMVMVRSREGNFVFSDDEFRAQLRDAHQMVAMGVSGLVFGCLTTDNRPNFDQMKALIDAADGRPTMIHRSSDSLTTQLEDLSELQKLGLSRVLTSGKGGVAIRGMDALTQMVGRFKGKMQVVAGGGIRPDNVAMILSQTGVQAIHFAARKNIDQPGYAGTPDPIPDPEMIGQMLEAVAAYDSSRA